MSTDNVILFFHGSVHPKVPLSFQREFRERSVLKLHHVNPFRGPTLIHANHVGEGGEWEGLGKTRVCQKWSPSNHPAPWLWA